MRLRTLGSAAAVTAVLAIGSTTAIAAEPDQLTIEPQGGGPTLSVSVVQRNLVYPWDLDFTPDGRMLVTERDGRVRIFAKGSYNAPLVATKTLKDVHNVGEAGAMGIAVDNSFASNQRVYVCATRDYHGEVLNQVLAYTLSSSSKLTFTHYVVQTGMQGASIHDGCAVEHGPDGKIWITMGDGSVSARAQDPGSLNGKILRVNPDGGIPSDNPTLPGNPGPSRAYSMGHRNPQGIDFQAGVPYAAEHGPELDDEINRIEAGENYGWPCYTGDDDPYITSGCGPASSYHAAAWESNSPTIATSGAEFLSNSDWGTWVGDFMVPTLKESDLRRFDSSDPNNFTQQQTLLNGTYGRLRAAEEGPSGQLYLTTSNGSNDKVIRITPTP